MFLTTFSKTPILQKSLFFLGEIAIFQVRRLKKSNKNRCKNALQNNIEKKGSKIKFWHPFWSPKPSKIAPQSDAKPSLFRDAMEPTWTSSQINGGHSFWTAKMARHMIRSSLSIDMPMVALIMVCISFQNLPKIHPKPSQNLPKILPKSSQNPSKTLPKPSQNPPKTLLRN